MVNQHLGGWLAMVKVGLICEGHTEKMILDSVQFREMLHSLQLEVVGEVINVEGNGNLLPKFLEDRSKALFEKGAEAIVILTDRDDAPCITSVRERIKLPPKHVLVVAVQKIEAWFLADSQAFSGLVKSGSYFCEAPELIDEPFEHIRALMFDLTGRGVGRHGGKIVLARKMLQDHHFSIARAAQHPSCPSARYFMDKLYAIAQS